jgi:hypothetical protein
VTRFIDGILVNLKNKNTQWILSTTETMIEIYDKDPHSGCNDTFFGHGYEF